MKNKFFLEKLIFPNLREKCINLDKFSAFNNFLEKCIVHLKD